MLGCSPRMYAAEEMGATVKLPAKRRVSAATVMQYRHRSHSHSSHSHSSSSVGDLKLAPSSSSPTVCAEQLAHKRRVAKRIKKYSTSKRTLKMNRLCSFLLHSVTPQDSTFEQYMLSGSHVHCEVVLENYRTGVSWHVARRYSALRDDVLDHFKAAHCHYCATLAREIAALDPLFPSKRLFGSKRQAVVDVRAQLFHGYLQGLLRLLSTTYFLNCRQVAGPLSSLVRTFLVQDAAKYRSIPGVSGKQVPSLLRELNAARTPRAKITLATIKEHVPRARDCDNQRMSEDESDDDFEEADPADDDEDDQNRKTKDPSDLDDFDINKFAKITVSRPGEALLSTW